MHIYIYIYETRWDALAAVTQTQECARNLVRLRGESPQARKIASNKLVGGPPVGRVHACGNNILRAKTAQLAMRVLLPSVPG